jgi:predicted ester cyclase
MSHSRAIGHSPLDDASAVAFARPDVLVSTGEAASSTANLAATYYGFWNNGSTALFSATVSPDYMDRTLPSGRQQGPSGLAEAGAAFFTAFPDGRVKVLQQMLVGDRIVSHLRVTGTFTGTRRGVDGAGQVIEYLATDIMRVADGSIVELACGGSRDSPPAARRPSIAFLRHGFWKRNGLLPTRSFPRVRHRSAKRHLPRRDMPSGVDSALPTVPQPGPAGHLWTANALGIWRGYL